MDFVEFCTFTVNPSNLCHVFIEMHPAWSGMGCSSDDPRWQCRGSSARAIETESPFSGHRIGIQWHFFQHLKAVFLITGIVQNGMT